MASDRAQRADDSDVEGRDVLVEVSTSWQLEERELGQPTAYTRARRRVSEIVHGDKGAIELE